MKIIPLLFVAGTLMLTGCSTTQNETRSGAHRAAIQSVFDQRAKLETKEGRISYFSKENLPKVMAIDVGNCPASFRSAWFDYLVQVQNLHTRAARVGEFAAASGKPVTDLTSLIKFAMSNAGLGEYLLGAVNRTDDAWDKLARTAMDYGVMPER